MAPARWLVLCIAAAPLAASAQVTYSRSWSALEGPVSCTERANGLESRRAGLEGSFAANDRERAVIDRETAILADELRNLDSSDTVAVARYNARSNALNARVQQHNQRVADLNSQSSLLNGDSADYLDACSGRYRPLR